MAPATTERLRQLAPACGYRLWAAVAGRPGALGQLGLCRRPACFLDSLGVQLVSLPSWSRLRDCVTA